MSSAGELPVFIEPFDPESHDRAAFSCRVGPVDKFFEKTAGKVDKAGTMRIFVVICAARPHRLPCAQRPG